jgi:aryl-alcohol dehydrogenase-like predicted oxidoreductase
VYYRTFGKSGILVSEIGIGCGSLGGPGKTELDNVLHHAIDLGINLFDTADVYVDGQSEMNLGRAFNAVSRDRLVLATKFGTKRRLFGGYKKNFSVKHMRRMFEQSLRRLKTDYIDIYQLHNPPANFLQRDDLWRELDRMLVAGKIRCYGLSIESPELARGFLEHTQGLGLQMILNPINQGARELLPDLRNFGGGMLVKVPLAGGTLTDRFCTNWPPKGDERRRRWGESGFSDRIQLTQALRPILTSNNRTFAQGALAWLLTISPNVVPIPGISSKDALNEIAAAAGKRLSQEEMNALDELQDGAFQQLRCGW